MPLDPNSLSARALAHRIRSGALSAQAVTEATLDRTARVNPTVNALVETCAEEALQSAHALDARIAAGGATGVLAGVPVTIKAIADQSGWATTNGATILRDVAATRDSPFLANMRRQDGIVIGRSNCPAFSYRWFTTNKLYGATQNPHNPALTAGGSSGGAGAATACGLGHVAHGTDIAGSIRYPAYACGVQGLRPTPGRVPMFNYSGTDRGIGPQLMAVAGPLARRVDDLRLGLEAMAGYSADDIGSAPVPLILPPQSRRVALIRNPGGIDTAPRLLDDLDRAAAILRAAGWEVEEPDTVPDLREAVELQIDLWLADDHATKLAQAEAEDDPGALALLRFYAARAQGIDVAHFGGLFPRRAGLVRAWRNFMQQYPLVLMPPCAALPFRQDEDLDGPEALARLWQAQLPQIAIPLLGLPGLSVSAGVVESVPSGVQLVAAPWREDHLLTAGEIVETGFGPPALVG